MSLINGTFNCQTRQLILPCNVCISGAVKTLRHPDVEKIVTKSCGALVDTGATHTCISEDLVQELALESYSMVPIVTAAGVTETKSYKIDLLLDFEGHHAPIENLTVNSIPTTKHQEWHILLGMDVILQGHLSISRGGLFAFAI